MSTPGAAKTLLRQLDDWSTQVRHATGPCEFGGLSEDTDGEGKRRRVSATEDVDSVLLRGTHVDGRAFVALWVRRPGYELATSKAAVKVRALLLRLAATELTPELAVLIGLVAGHSQWTHRGWTLDLAWRGRRPDEFTPKQITATQLKAYVAHRTGCR